MLLVDQRRIEELEQRIAGRRAAGRPAGRDEARLAELQAAAGRRALQRQASVPRIRYPEDLPVSARAAEIRAAIQAHPVLVVCGDTGSGKTTQLPKACLEAGRGLTGLIGHTQPRRIAARTVASRLAEELGAAPGTLVGFKVRMAESGGDDSLVRVMTDGILLAEIQGDPELLRYDTIIIDEAHERSLNIDFLLGYLKRLLPRRPDLRILITSATIDPQRFSAFFNDAPIIEVSGRGHPIETRYRAPAADEDDDLDPGLVPAIGAALDELEADPATRQGDVLVFLPGEREIRDAAEFLAHRRLEVLPLYSRLGWAEQQRVFAPGGRRRVVLATNVAETSITVPGIRAVIDSGLARIARYSPRTKILRLPVEKISQASANQRQGRCGRVGPGICIRLYSEEDFGARETHTPPEVLRTNLARVILQMEALALGALSEFPFIDAPDTRLVSDGYRLLFELEALDGQQRLTPMGRTLARLPVDPRLARMLAEATRHAALAELLTLVAFLSIQDPRERPAGQQPAADEKHALFADPRSDFQALLKLWEAWRGIRRERSGNQARRWCREHFLSALRMREWEELRSQLAQVATELGWREGEAPAGHEGIHRCLLAGLLGGIGERSETGEFLGPRGLRFVIAPGSPLAKRPPRWVMAGSLVETRRVYARQVAAIEPAWIEAAAHHLVRRSYSEPEWQPEQCRVAALETVTLHGLVLSAGRRVNYARVEPAAAREIFVREALVQGNCRMKGKFVAANRHTLKRIEEAEARLRAHGALLDEDRLAAWFLARVPAHVNDLPSFGRWQREAEGGDPRWLQFSAGEVLREGASWPDATQYPDSLQVGGHALRLRYHFEPGQAQDGATIELPLALLASLDPAALEWGVPAWRLERLTAALRGLPKPQRRALVPVPNAAAACLQAVDPAGRFFEQAAAWLSRHHGAELSGEQLLAVPQEPWLELRLAVIDERGRSLAEGRDLAALQRRLGDQSRAALQSAVAGAEAAPMADWDCGELAETTELHKGGIRLTVYPALEDRGDAAALVACETQAQAEAIHRGGVGRLLALALTSPLQHAARACAADRELALLLQPVMPMADFIRQCCDRAVDRCCLQDAPLPRSRAAFEEALERGRPEVYEEARRVMASARRALQLAHELRRLLASLTPGVDAGRIEDCRRQLGWLLGPGFVGDTEDPWLDELPRLLRGLEARVRHLVSGRNPGQQDEMARWLTVILAEESRSPGVNRAAPLRQLHWMIAEYCVSLFAQALGTRRPVSPQRLTRQLEQWRAGS